jgi:hypothetical protein
MCTVKCTFKARTARWVYQILIFLAVYVAYDHISFWQFAGIYMIYNTSIKYLIPIITFGACIVHLTVSCDVYNNCIRSNNLQRKYVFRF